MNRIAKASLIIVGGFILNLPPKSFGQSAPKTPRPMEKEEQEIVIRKKGDKKEKTTIVIDGEKVTINGKPMEEYNDKDITIMKMKRPGTMAMGRMSPRARVMGIPGADMEGMDFAQILSGKKALLGVSTEKTEDGAKVISVSKESAAEKAGLKKDDIITKVDKEQITSPQDLIEAISERKPADKVDITYKRNGKEDKVSATLGENKNRSFNFNMDENNFKFEMPDKAFGPLLDGNMFRWNRKPKIGMQIQDVEEGKGVKVNEVEADSPASKSGFKEGDIITGINGKQVEGVDDLKTQLKDLKEGDAVKFEFNRGGKAESAEIKIPKKLKTADL
ncbi:MAG: PDZ domain-containing protein [Chitinophagaceae bacterium]|nr:PDZ domain-containing protein [Chitinophagaceae bacterium]